MQSNKTGLIVQQAVQAVPLECIGTEGPTIYFDGSCPLCSAEINHYASRDGGDQLTFVDVSGKDADLGTGLACSDAMRRFHVRLPDGTLLSGARAFVAVWAALPGWAWAARLAKIPGVIPLMEVAYRAFLPARPVLPRVAGYFGARAANGSSNHP
jgi:predicted DCC family thiol-disulfide oxidoreductase YuxK